MKVNHSNSNLFKDEINFYELIKLFWKEKLIIFIIIFISNIFFFYIFTKDKLFRTEVEISSPPISLFYKYKDVFPQPTLNQFHTLLPKKLIKHNHSFYVIDERLLKYSQYDYMHRFRTQILSLEVLQQFVDKHEQIDLFKTYLKKNNITAKQFFEKKIGHVVRERIDKKNYPNKFYLIFPKQLDGRSFLYSYVFFVKNIIESELKTSLRDNVLFEINNISKKLEINKSKSSNNQEEITSNKQKEIKTRLIKLNENIKIIDNLYFDYNPIVNETAKPFDLSVSSKLMLFAGFVVGLLFSLIYILLKQIIFYLKFDENKNYK